MRVILDTHRRRRLLQRTVAVAVLVAAIVLAGSAEGLRWASHRRVADAQQALQRLGIARESALVARGDHMRRQLNRSGFRAWAAALATLTPAARPRRADNAGTGGGDGSARGDRAPGPRSSARDTR